jgi:dTDP-4-amino-4,6-dideoxygalactose transaminase
MKINIVKPVLPDLAEIQEEFQQCLSSGMVTNNSYYVKNYEEALKKFFQSPLAPICYCNGELALHSLIQAWKTKLGYDVHDSFNVLVPSFTFSGTINALVSNNLKPIFCDIDQTLTIDLNKIDTPDSNTKMLLPVGVYGNLPDIEKAKAFSESHGMALIFDHAPAFGATYKGQPPAHYEIEEIYSFHATKIYNSMEGGAALTHDKEIHSLLSRIRDFGQYEKSIGDVDIPGLNSKMQEISAIVGLKNLEKINDIISKRKYNIQQYKTFFNTLKSKGYLDIMHVKDEVFCPYLYFPIILNEEASKFITHLKEYEISARRYYTSVHTLKYYKDKYQSLNLDCTNSIKDRIVALPIHSIMEQSEIDYLFSVIEKFFKQ